MEFACIEFVVVVISPTIVPYGERERRGYAQLCQSQGIFDLPINVVLIRRSRGFAPTALPYALCQCTVLSSLFLFRFSINRVHAKYSERFPRDISNIVRIRSVSGFCTTITTIWDQRNVLRLRLKLRSRTVGIYRRETETIPPCLLLLRTQGSSSIKATSSLRLIFHRGVRGTSGNKFSSKVRRSLERQLLHFADVTTSSDNRLEL